jgi:hypothetical protein
MTDEKREPIMKFIGRKLVSVMLVILAAPFALLGCIVFLIRGLVAAVFLMLATPFILVIAFSASSRGRKGKK